MRAWAEAHEPKTTGMRIFVKLDGGAVKLPGGVITTLNNVEASDTIESVVNRTWWDNQNLINGADGERGGFTSASCWARYSSVWVEPRAEPDKDDGRQEKKPVHGVLHRNLPCAPDKPLPRDKNLCPP